MKIKFIFTTNAQKDYSYWNKNNKKIFSRINKILEEIRKNPKQGIGNPKPLKHALSGFWSRRINSEHRIVYKIEKEIIYIAQLRYHY